MTAPALPATAGGTQTNRLADDFAAWTIDTAALAISTAITAALGERGFKANRAYVEEHDHWQKGDTWMGPTGGKDPVVRALVLQAVERQFTPVDVISEVLENVANGLLKTEADVSFAPFEPAPEDDAAAVEAQEAEADAMLSAISAWWDRKQLWTFAREAVKRARWASRGGMRLWIAPSSLVLREVELEGGGVTQQTELPSGLTFADALARVELSAPLPDQAMRFVHPVTQQPCAIFLFTSQQGQPFAELWFVDGDGADAETVLRVVGRADGRDTAQEFRLAIGRRLPFAEMRGTVLITEPVRRQQARLNFFESLLTRVGETAGFPERYTTNAKPQGIWMETPPADGPALETVSGEDGKTWYLHPTPRTLGAAITTDLRGIETIDVAGNTTVATPGVTFKEPTDPQFAITAAEHARHTILRECKQGHLALTSAAEASGIAYQQARAGHENDLTNTKGPLETMVRETIEGAIAIAGVMSDEMKGFLDRFRCVVTCHVSAGPLTPDEKRVNGEMADKGLLSEDSAMAANGIEDVASERALIEAEPRARLDQLKKQAEIVVIFTTAGAAFDAACRAVGIDEETVAKLVGEGSPDLGAVPQ